MQWRPPQTGNENLRKIWDALYELRNTMNNATQAITGGSNITIQQIAQNLQLGGQAPLPPGNQPPSGPVFYQTLGINNTSEPQRNRLNLIGGNNVTLTFADSPGSNSSNVTISAAGGGGGGSNLFMVDPANANAYAIFYADQGAYHDNGVTLATNGQSVQQWNDQSGGNHHLQQLTSAARPTYFTTGGPPSLTNRINFNGGQGFVSISNYTVSTFQVFVLFRLTSGGIIVELSPNVNSNDGFYMYGQTSDTSVVKKSAVASAIDYSVPTGFWSSQAMWMLPCLAYQGTHATHRLNIGGSFVPITNLANNDPGNNNTTDTFNVGARGNASSAGSTGDIIAVVLFTPATSDANIIGVTNFLLNKYNI